MKNTQNTGNNSNNGNTVYTETVTPHISNQTINPVINTIEKTKEDIIDESNTDTTSDKEKLEKQEKQEKQRKASLISIRQLYSYADKYDICLMIIGTIAAIGTGIIQPLQTIFFGDILNSFNSPSLGDQMQSAINRVILKFVYIGFGMFASGFLQSTCWTITASRQSKRLKQNYVQSIIRQDIGWYDQHDPLELATKVADLMTTIQEGIGRKMAEGAQFFAMFVGGFIIGFIKGWELTLVILACSPFLAVATYIMMKALAAAVSDGSAAYAKAGGIAEETLGSIRTVHSFNAIEERVKKFNAALKDTEKAGIKKGVATGFGGGSLFLVCFITYAIALYFGAYKVVDDRENCHGSHCYDGGKVLMVFFAVITGAMALGQAGPSMEAVFSAKAAAYDVFELMSRKSLIDPFSKEGNTKEKLEGHIEVKDVTFRYPSRKEVTVCKNYNLMIKAGEKVALVGPSGSGKSTVISLLERFYDPEIGCILVDGIDIREYNVRWLRQQISLVGQEPVLFSMSILENIKYGKINQVTDEEAINAAKKANAYDFIMKFPKAFDTQVGERGIQLSGGQKQRIAIARAIVKDPSILLLDEATSALDTESERIVQDSLDALLSSKNRTTIIVAHRLSTIQDANRIAVHDSGNIVEIGTHAELMNLENGKYRKLVETQRHGYNENSNNLSFGSSTPQSEKASPISPIATENNAIMTAEESSHEMQEVKLANDDKSTTTPQKSLFSCLKKNESGKEKKVELQVPLSRIWGFSKPDKLYVVLGCFGAMVSGCVFPIWGFMITKMTVLFYESGSRGHLLYTARLWAMGFALLGVCNFIGAMLQNTCFFLVSERITRRIRSLCFNRMLQQEIGWFDMDENLSGALTTRLATDSAIIQSITSESLNRTVMTIFTLGAAITISFIHSWQMTLVFAAIFPVMGFSAYMESQVMTGKTSKKTANDSDAKAGSLLSETVGAIRTVSSFCLEEHLMKQYNGLINESDETDRNKAVVGGIAFCFANGLIFFAASFLYWFGGELVSHKHITFEEMFMVIMCLMLSSFGVGIAAQNLGDAGRAKEAANNIFKIIDRKPLIDAMDTQGLKPESVKGHIVFKNLDFIYPSRPKVPIYTGYSLEVPQGQTVALVGPSGSGKSTAISLLERFYNPVAGSILLDGVDIKSYNILWLRQNVSLVSQEPSLFAGTIEENIKFGKFDATHEEVVQACRNANAHNFIMQFPDQYQTNVGDRGVQISGGQKQRIAIARAILRDPAILLLDEATSALDNESEEIVQKSLDQLLLMKKRTTIIVAHRLSTIQNADKIAVTQNGQIVEEGKHDDLMRISNGVYKTLVSKQMSAFSNKEK